MRRALLLSLIAGVGCKTAPEIPADSYVHTLRRTLPAVRALAEQPLTVAWLDRAADLPPRAPRAIHRGSEGRVLAEREFAQLPPVYQAGFTSETFGDDQYYARYSSPLAYYRALDLAAQHGLRAWRGARLVDFGYGNIGQLQMMALEGAVAVGVDPGVLLPALYGEPEDLRFPPGEIVLVHDTFPSSTTAQSRVGQGAQLFLSKNTLKRGYIHPEPLPGQTVDPRRLIQLGVSDEGFVRAVVRSLAPGGLFVIYNLAPAPAPAGRTDYIPWADGRCPFPSALLEAEGLEVLAFDVDDTARARTMGRALEWDRTEEPTDLDRDLFAWYTIARKR